MSADEIRSMATPLRSTADLDPLLERVGDARVVLLGEASHGTSEYYGWRAAITRRLIDELGFSFVAVEGDWPDCFEVNRWVKGLWQRDLSPVDILDTFDRWPAWMWANTEVARFCRWLRAHNEASGANVGFYGLDVYSLWESLRSVHGYLRDNDADALAAAIEACRCFDPYGEDAQRYAYATRMVPASCEREVIDLLVSMRSLRSERAGGDRECELDARQNAEVVAGAERYYRAMVRADGESWNVRDCHMADTLDRLIDFHGPAARAVVWAHNTHVGDARATDMIDAGMINLGEVVRERHGEADVVIVGFGGHRGSVVAGRAWDAPHETMTVSAAKDGSHEQVLHEVLGEPSLLVFPDDRTTPWLRRSRPHRAIGVVYRPEGDRWGNWVPTVIGRRYDAFVHLEETNALTPLHGWDATSRVEPATYPWST